jgi:putative heme-binding domain-containing protein
MKADLFIAGLLIVCSAGSLMGQRGGGAGQPNPFLGNTQAIAEGEALYNKTCTSCHGANGGGGEIGPAIVAGDRTDIGVSDAQTFNIIKNGVAGTPMRPQGLPDSDIWKIVAYIHALRGTAIDNPLPGDVAHGEQVFLTKGQCGTCHMLSGKGGLTAPDLSNIAGVRKSSSIVDALTKEKHRINGSGGAHLRMLPTMDEYLPVHVTTADGKTIDGVLLNEDGYSLQLIGNDNQLHLFDRARLRRVVVEPKSLMPTDYDKRLTPAEFKDLLAFLTRQGTVAPPSARRGGPPQVEQ